VRDASSSGLRGIPASAEFGRQRQRPVPKDSPRFAPTLGGRLAERGLRSANDVYTPTGTSGTRLGPQEARTMGRVSFVGARPEPSD
jgi:hypothetical protein